MHMHRQYEALQNFSHAQRLVINTYANNAKHLIAQLWRRAFEAIRWSITPTLKFIFAVRIGVRDVFRVLPTFAKKLLAYAFKLAWRVTVKIYKVSTWLLVPDLVVNVFIRHFIALIGVWIAYRLWLVSVCVFGCLSVRCVCVCVDFTWLLIS